LLYDDEQWAMIQIECSNIFTLQLLRVEYFPDTLELTYQGNCFGQDQKLQSGLSYVGSTAQGGSDRCSALKARKLKEMLRYQLRLFQDDTCIKNRIHMLLMKSNTATPQQTPNIKVKGGDYVQTSFFTA
jgi:hypothetical protein